MSRQIRELDVRIFGVVGWGELGRGAAWAAQEARQRRLDAMAANIREFLAGGRRSRVV
jgi:transketolase N-terminal domain/subunit